MYTPLYELQRRAPLCKGFSCHHTMTSIVLCAAKHHLPRHHRKALDVLVSLWDRIDIAAVKAMTVIEQGAH